MSLSDCIACWDTPCTCGWCEAACNSEHYLRIASEYLEMADKVKNHNLVEVDRNPKTFVKDIQCTRCGLRATYETWNRDFFNNECKPDE